MRHSPHLKSSQAANSDQSGDDINITPLMDVVFILLVFFVVTTSFVREQGIDLARPSQAPQTPEAEAPNIALYVDTNDYYRLNGRVIEAGALAANLQRQHAVQPNAKLIIVADRSARTESLVRAVDQGHLAGFASISVTAVVNP